MDDLVIRKDNHIIQKTLNKFSYKQNQLMAVLLAKYVNLKTDECINTTVSVDELRTVLGVTSEGGNAYERIRHAIEQFGERGSVGIYSLRNGKPKWTWMPYFSKIELTENKVEFQWNEGMKPYLIKLKKNYTQYLANDYLKLHSIYSQNLYEQLKSLENYKKTYNKNPQMSVEEIRQIMQVNGKKAYERWGAFKQLVLDKAVAEINKVTDLNVSYTTKKKAHTVVAVEFDIKRKKHNKTKDQKEGLPDWYADTEQHAPDPKLMAEIDEMLADLNKGKKEDVKANKAKTDERGMISIDPTEVNENTSVVIEKHSKAKRVSDAELVQMFITDMMKGLSVDEITEKVINAVDPTSSDEERTRVHDLIISTQQSMRNILDLAKK